MVYVSNKYLNKRTIADSAQGLFVSIGACIDRTRFLEYILYCYMKHNELRYDLIGH